VPLLIVLAATPGMAFQAPIPLGEMIGTADAVMVGTITETFDSGIRVRVEEVLAGEVRERSIEVQRFPAPAESPRWAPYAGGQTIVFFLKRSSEQPGDEASAAWTIMGRIGEGEIPLEGDSAFLHGRYLDVEALPQGYYEFHGQTSYLQRLEREVVLDALRTYRECWDWRAGPRDSGAPTSRCSREAQMDYASRSALHSFLMEESQTSAN